MLEKGIITLFSLALWKFSPLGQLAFWMLGLSQYLEWLDVRIITLSNLAL